MSPWINYHHLFYFKTIAEEGSVSKAAEKLRLGQPTLSAQLKQFEDVLGVELFKREHKKLTLTEHGKVALTYSKSIFKLGSEMYEVLQDQLKPLKPSLHIGSLDSIPKQIILQMVQHAYKISPCQITLSEGKSEDLLRDLNAHLIDIVITNFLPLGANSKGIYSRSIAKKNVSIFASHRFKSLRKDFPQSLSGAPLILPTYASRLRQDFDQWAARNKLELNIIAESQDIAVKKLMAINGLGVIPVATHTVTNQVLCGDLIEIGTLKGIKEELFLLTASRQIENTVARQLRDSFHI